MSDITPTHRVRSRRRRFVPISLVTGVLASAALAATMTGTLAGFTAQITNSVNTTATGSLVMQEQNSAGTTTCTSTDAGSNSNSINTNASTCSTINKYGGSAVFVPGSSSSTTITIKNTGTVPANTFTLAPGACTQGTNGTVNGSATDFCSKLAVVITQSVSGGTATTVSPANSTLTTLASGGAITLATPIAAGVTVTYNFTVTLSSTVGNTYQGLSASQPLVWQFTS